MEQLSPDRPTAKTPQSIKSFIHLCWFKESAQRPTAQAAVEAFEQDIERELAPNEEELQMTKAEGKEAESPPRPSP